ncbi:MAG: GNAT family N-acetyltransferase [Actinomycetota bacterium]|nr:GNAT family N-acetyltransferase [Actinomycetota bacterium]
MPKCRLGVALLLPATLVAEVDGLRRALGDGALGRIPPHLTLVPPVNVREDRVDEAFAVLRRAAAGTRPFRLELGPPASFLPDNPVVHLTVGGEVAALRALRDAVFADPLARPLTWPWVPHVTLADDAPPDRIAAAISALAGYVVEAAFARVHLLRESSGRVWEPIADAAFATPAVTGRGGLPLELSVTEHLEGHTPFAVTARREGQVVGTATGATAGAGCELHALAVAEHARRQGVGSRLLAAVESLAAARDCVTITVTAPADPVACAFLASRGWREAAGQLRRELA